jgi:hypothetical protein
MTFFDRWIDDLKLIYSLHRGEFAYLRDPQELMRRAMTFDTDVLPPFEENTRTTFDFDYLDAVTARLKDVPRGLTLTRLMENLSRGAANDIVVYERLMFFCQTVSWNFMTRQPVHRRPNGVIVSDPILLLDMHEMRCGHIARVVCDLAMAYGWRARLVQLAGHVTAEVEIDGRWLLADADVFGGGVIPRLPNGDYGSVAEFSEHPDWLDKPFSYLDSTIMFPSYRKNSIPGALPYPSYYYFSSIAYGAAKPQYMYKDPDQEIENDRFYGWARYFPEDADDIQVHPIELQYACSAPNIINISNVSGVVRIDWDPLKNPISPAALYKIYFYKESRNWQYPRFVADDRLQKYWVAPKPLNLETYQAVSGAMHGDVVVETTEPFIEIPVSRLSQCQYFSVMSLDARAIELGRERGNCSYEYTFPHGDAPAIDFVNERREKVLREKAKRDRASAADKK